MIRILLLGLFVAALPRTIFAQPVAGKCSVFPSNNIWNTPVDRLPVHPRSQAYVASIGTAKKLKADFGSGLWNGGPIGIPFTLATGTGVRVAFEYADESDPGPYPIPANPPIEGGEKSDGDRHILIVDQKSCRLYELYAARKSPNGWKAGSGAIFDLSSNALRPSGWTSADAAGLPIFPGLVRYEEVASGEIKHAVRFTARRTQRAFVWPARHFASRITDAGVPPMGARFRLKASFPIEGFSKENQVILRALKKYGMILADNGSDWFVSGAPSEKWNNDLLRELGRITGDSFEAVDVSSLMVNPDSGEARSAPGQNSNQTKVDPESLPAEYSGERADWEEWHTVKESWMKNVYFGCLKQAGLRMSCGGCPSIYTKWVFSVDDAGRLSMEKYKESICGRASTPALDRCMTETFRNKTFVKLRGRRFRATLGTGLSC